MARKSEFFTVTDSNRDQGKTFQLTEMSARDAEYWAMRAMSSLCTSGILGEMQAKAIQDGGAVAFSQIAMRALATIPSETARSLLDEAMRKCVKFKAPVATRDLIDSGSNGDDIEEVSTRLQIYSKLVELHTGFTVPVAG